MSLWYYADNNQILALMDENQKKENENIDEFNLRKDMENKIYSFYELFFSEELDKKTFTHKKIEEGREQIGSFCCLGSLFYMI